VQGIADVENADVYLLGDKARNISGTVQNVDANACSKGGS
jgi:hypothetical protein